MCFLIVIPTQTLLRSVIYAKHRLYVYNNVGASGGSDGISTHKPY